MLLFILNFGIPPFTEAKKEDPFFKYLCYGPKYMQFLFKQHPATRKQYLEGRLDVELSELLLALLDPNPEKRPRSMDEVKEFDYVRKL